MEKHQKSLYQDNGKTRQRGYTKLVILSNVIIQQKDKMQKNVISIFKSIDFKIKITTNLKEVDFLEVISNKVH